MHTLENHLFKSSNNLCHAVFYVLPYCNSPIELLSSVSILECAGCTTDEGKESNRILNEQSLRFSNIRDTIIQQTW